MKIHEYQAKEIFAVYGIPVEKHMLCDTPEAVQDAFTRIGCERAVVKAQVLTGGRGKAGGIKIASNRQEAYDKAKEILSMSIKGMPVEKVLLSEAIDIRAEFYVGITIDRNTRSVTLMLSAEGGMDIEETARFKPDKIHRFIIHPAIGLPDFLARKYSFELFPSNETALRGVSILKSLYQVFMQEDASLAEINPLVLNGNGELKAIDAKLVFDDNALYRHPNVTALHEPTPEERIEIQARNCGFSYVRMNGNIGCMVNGAGLAMATMDLIKHYGGDPANFLDIGGSSNPRKVTDAMELLLRDPKVNVVLVNIFGGITRCDDVARGLITAVDTLKPEIPIVVRLTGTNEQNGLALLSGHHFFVLDSLEKAAYKAVTLSKQNKNIKL